ncbi:hypothetical protein B0H13DRAFT_2332589 [Mycena leptocephala]|nr:hypothetical protein B0H13DRAFT_2332589 [Mycena leptocephala]
MASALTDAETYGLFFESVFYGVYLVTCGFCVRTLFTTQTGLKRLRDLNWPMIVVAFLLFGIATVDAVLQFTRNLHTFQIADGPTDAANDFSAISDPVNVVKSATVCFQTTIADIMLVYRCWVVYSRSWLAISLPALLVMGNTAVTGVPFGAAFWALTIVINVLTTAFLGLIVARIWKINSGTKDTLYASESQTRSSRRPSNKLQRVMRIVIESGILYTGTSLITFVSYITNSIAVYVTTDVEVQIIGIAFNLIIIRAAQTSQENYSTTSGTARSHGQYPLRLVGTGTQNTVVPNTLQHINVTVTEETDLDDKARF